MRMAARGLGKGLDSLIPNTVGEAKVKKEAQNVAEPKAPETFVKITKVEPNREQPRKNFDEDALQELANAYIEEDEMLLEDEDELFDSDLGADNIFADEDLDNK